MDIRPSPIAGTWYPKNPESLRRKLDFYFDHASVQIPTDKIFGIVAPHAGHIYSGPVAAYAFKCLSGLKPDIIVIISPMHYPYDTPIITTAHDAYETPLGIIEVDRKTLEDLDRRLKIECGYRATPVRNDPEHAIEIELPFLQYVIKNFRFIPLMLREQKPYIIEQIGRALAEILRDRNALVVASSDLSHYQNQNSAQKLDKELLRRVENFDPKAVLTAEDEGVGSACGAAAISAALWTAKYLGANHVDILHYATSGDVTGDYHSVVGYGAAVITQRV